MLTAQAERFDGFLVTLLSSSLQIVQQLPATCHHLQQTAPCGVVLRVGVQVLGEVIDALRQQCDLHVGTAGVLFMKLKSAKGGGLGFAHGF